MKRYEFKSYIRECGPILDEYPDIIIKNEPMLFGCDEKYARMYGGPITQNFLGLLRHCSFGDDYIIDSRVHMSFTEGVYCCIPGWHHDNVPRTREDGQPNYDNPPDVQHILALVNADIAPTEFAIGTAIFPDIEPGEKYYKKWHPIVEKYIEFGQLSRFKVEDRKLYRFDNDSFHQGTPTLKKGWRFFIRAMQNNHRQKPANEIRKQVQIYLPNPMEGW